MISPSSTNPAVTQVGDYIFRVCFYRSFSGDVMASLRAKQLKAKKAAIMLDFNSPYSRGLTEFFEASSETGERLSDKQSYTQGIRDYKGQLTRHSFQNPDVIYVPGYYGGVGVIAKQAKQLDIKVPMLGGDGWDSTQLWDLGGDALNGDYISNHYSVDDPSPGNTNLSLPTKLVMACAGRAGGPGIRRHASAGRFHQNAPEQQKEPKLRDAIAGGNEKLCRP